MKQPTNKQHLGLISFGLVSEWFTIPSAFLFFHLSINVWEYRLSFNRLSRSLWHIQTTLFSVWSTVDYDDYPTVEPDATSAKECAEGVLRALGRKFVVASDNVYDFG